MRLVRSTTERNRYESQLGCGSYFALDSCDRHIPRMHRLASAEKQIRNECCLSLVRKRRILPED